MVKLLFIAILVIHGLIHLMGFVKAFQLAEIKELTMPISKPFGVVWLLTALVFIITAIIFMLDVRYWHLSLISATIISQILIFKYWKDAKFGTLLNVLLIVCMVVSF